MSKKENLNQAAFEMFGIGKAPSGEKAVSPVKPEKSAPVASVNAEPVKAAPAAATCLAPGALLEGKLTTQGDVEIAGIFKGELKTDGNVLLRANMEGSITAAKLVVANCVMTGDVHISDSVQLNDKAQIKGNIYAGKVMCAGQIEGDLSVQDVCEFESTARVNGDISTGSMVMAQGAIVTGNLKMNK